MSELTKRLRERGIEVSANRARLYEGAVDRIDKLEECLRELVADITDSEHSPHDWSEQVVVKQARALLGEK